MILRGLCGLISTVMSGAISTLNLRTSDTHTQARVLVEHHENLPGSRLSCGEMRLFVARRVAPRSPASRMRESMSSRLMGIASCTRRLWPGLNPKFLGDDMHLKRGFMAHVTLGIIVVRGHDPRI